MWKRLRLGGKGLSWRLERRCGVGLPGSWCGTPLPSLGRGWDFPSIPRYFLLSRSLPTWPGTGVSVETSYCSGSFPQHTSLPHLQVPAAVAGSDDWIVGSGRQLHDIKDRVKTSHRGREDQTVGILSDASFDWVGAQAAVQKLLWRAGGLDVLGVKVDHVAGREGRCGRAAAVVIPCHIVDESQMN